MACQTKKTGISENEDATRGQFDTLPDQIDIKKRLAYANRSCDFVAGGLSVLYL
jgi:hypothetical protein